MDPEGGSVNVALVMGLLKRAAIPFNNITEVCTELENTCCNLRKERVWAEKALADS